MINNAENKRSKYNWPNLCVATLSHFMQLCFIPMVDASKGLEEGKKNKKQ